MKLVFALVKIIFRYLYVNRAYFGLISYSIYFAYIASSECLIMKIVSFSLITIFHFDISYISILVAQFMYIIRKRIQLPPEKAMFLFVNKVLPATR